MFFLYFWYIIELKDILIIRKDLFFMRGTYHTIDQQKFQIFIKDKECQS